MQTLKSFLEELASREGHARAKALDQMVKSALVEHRIGRLIVRAEERGFHLIAKALARIIQLELREYDSVIDLDKHYELFYRGKMIAQKVVSPFNYALGSSFGFL